MHFVLDEAASLGNLSQIDDAVDKFRGYGVRLMFVYQSLGQLRKCFPEGQEQTLLSNVTQVYFGVNDQQTADYVSARLGEETIVVKSGGTSRSRSRQYSEGNGNGSYSTSWNTNDNWQQQARKLLKSEEVTALSPRTAITFAPGVPPICTQLTRYYEGRPDSFWRQQARGLRATYLATIMLAATVVAAKSVAENYQYRLEHPPRVRAVPNGRFR